MKINNINLLSKAGIPYISDRWFLSSGWTIDSINCVLMQRLNGKAVKAVLKPTHPGLFDFSKFQELTNTGQPDCVLQ